MARSPDRIVAVPPDWAMGYIDTLKHRVQAGERVDVDKAEKLIKAFTNYYVI